MLKGQEPLVSIITLNFNQTQISCEFLESTRNLTYTNYEILVCDMGSAIDPTAQIMQGNYPKTSLLISSKNLGFAAGNNWGIEQAKGDYFLIINNDTEVTPGLIELLLEPFFNNPKIGAVSPKIKFFYHPGLIQYAGFNPFNVYTGRTSTIGEGEKDDGRFNKPGFTYGAHGCAMMVSREVIIKAGMFPEKFFLYYEEWDLSARIRKAGYSIWYAANALVLHKESMSVGKNNPVKAYYLTRNRILYMRRNTSPGQLAIFTIFFTFFTLPKSIFACVFKRDFRALGYVLKGSAWNVFNNASSKI